MRKAIDRSFLTRLLRTTALSLALMMATAVGVRAETVTVQGTDGADGAVGVNLEPGQPGGDGGGAKASAGSVNPITSPLNQATAIGGNGGKGGSGQTINNGLDGGDGGNGGKGGAADAFAATAIISGSAKADAISNGGKGGPAGGGGGVFTPDGISGAGGDAFASSTATSGSGNASSSATATGGNGGIFGGAEGGLNIGVGGDARADSTARSNGSGVASSSATATGGDGGPFNPPADASASSTAISTGSGVSVKSTAVESSTFGDTVTTIAIAQTSSSQAFVTPDAHVYAFSTALPDKADAARLIDGASNVADALLGLHDVVFRTAILGGGSSTFDFTYRGDLLLGLIDWGGEVIANGVEIAAASSGSDEVINLGSSFGPDIGLTFMGNGDVAMGGTVVPETSTWAMMLIGFAGLGFAGYRASRKAAAA
jgi:hypothetical protein